MKFSYVIISLFLLPWTACGNTQDTSFIPIYDNAISNIQSVEFLNITEAAISILDETYEPYFSQLQIREIHALTGSLPPISNLGEARDFARDKFASAVTSFTDNEKEAIQFTISVINKTLRANSLEIIANHSWKFIKIEDWLCGGFAHTRGDFIILSQRHLQHLSQSWSQTMTHSDSVEVIKKLGSLLVHEQFHCLQRKYPEKFEELYTKSWGFEKACILADSSIAINQLMNPDAPKAEWVTNYDGSYLWIRTLINSNIVKPKMGKDFIDVVFTLEKNEATYSVVKDSLSNPKVKSLSDYPKYVNSFPVTQGLDHPNEISAYMFSSYFVSIFEENIPFKNAHQKSISFTQEYLIWLQENF